MSRVIINYHTALVYGPAMYAHSCLHFTVSHQELNSWKAWEHGWCSL